MACSRTGFPFLLSSSNYRGNIAPRDMNIGSTYRGFELSGVFYEKVLVKVQGN